MRGFRHFMTCVLTKVTLTKEANASLCAVVRLINETRYTAKQFPQMQPHNKHAHAQIPKKQRLVET